MEHRTPHTYSDETAAPFVISLEERAGDLFPTAFNSQPSSHASVASSESRSVPHRIENCMAAFFRRRKRLSDAPLTPSHAPSAAEPSVRAFAVRFTCAWCAMLTVAVFVVWLWLRVNNQHHELHDAVIQQAKKLRSVAGAAVPQPPSIKQSVLLPTYPEAVTNVLEIDDAGVQSFEQLVALFRAVRCTAVAAAASSSDLSPFDVPHAHLAGHFVQFYYTTPEEDSETAPQCTTQHNATVEDLERAMSLRLTNATIAPAETRHLLCYGAVHFGVPKNVLSLRDESGATVVVAYNPRIELIEVASEPETPLSSKQRECSIAQIVRSNDEAPPSPPPASSAPIPSHGTLIYTSRENLALKKRMKIAGPLLTCALHAMQLIGVKPVKQ